MDEAVTTDRHDRRPLLVVGLGASAGGLGALQAFFAAMPDDSDLAFVVITHQAAGRTSLMPELLGRTTGMPVTQISAPTRILPNHVYTATPGFNLTISAGVVEPIEVAKPPATMPVDVFFRSLARDQKERAVGIILSGTGSDGSLGLKAIKAELGMVMAQDQQSAQYDGMPQSAIATELVDHVLSPAELAAQLADYAELRRSGVAAPASSGDSAESLQPIFALIRSRTGHDFSRYKLNTMRRRIERRMTVHHLDSLERYTRYLRDRPGEIDLLFGDLLIGVTSFFRDPEAWEALAPAVRELLESKPDDDVVRAWVPGCSTGEEAYSLAMLLREALEELERRVDVQIFATDIDAAAIEAARSGRYPVGIGSDVSSARLARFFTRDGDFYRVRKEIREMLVFAPHDLISDPPFTKVDILSCRNLLIYLDGELQDRLVPIFHYALKPGGLLLLGSSESVGRWAKLFSDVDKERKIFRRAEVPAGTYSTDLPAPSYPADERRPPSHARARRDASLEQAVQRLLLDTLVPPTVLLHERGDVIHVHGKTGFFLQPAEGPQSNPNIFDMARQGLQISLASALREASANDREVVRRDVRIKTNGDEYTVDLRVRPVHDPALFKGMFLATFERGHPSEADGGDGEAGIDEPTRVSDLERALLHARESHQGTISELESANQDLKSTNEELQSTNEEIETSKEEMQSLNEELQTVNTELQGKVDELSNANDDMANLLNSTDIATVFVDSHLRIKRYTEQAREVIRLIPSDVGRSIGDLVSTLQYRRLMDDASEVLRTLVPKEIEVRSDRKSYLMRILPYRTTENVIDGLVITFVDVTKIQALQEEQRRLLEALRTSPASIWAQDTDLRITWACSPLFGQETDEVTGKSDHDLFERADADRLTAIKKSVLESGSPERRRLELSINGERRTYHLYVAPNRDAGGGITGVSCVAVDVTWLQESKQG